MLKWLSKADTGADVFVRWAAVVGLMIAGYTWLASKLPWFGQIGLAEMVAIAIPAALVTLLAVTGSLALYRYFRPLGGAASSLATLSYDDSELRTMVLEIKGRQQRIIDDYQRMLAAATRFDEAEEAHKGQFDTLFLALQAILAREQILKLTETLHEKGSALAAVLQSDEKLTPEQWQLWLSDKTTFESGLRRWLDIACGWHPQAEARIEAVDPREFIGKVWRDIDQRLPGHDAVITFKTFMLKLRNWRTFEDQVRTVIQVGAFGGPNASKILESMYNTPTLEAVQKVFDHGRD